ncbi:ABC transporter substrate-binding protein [Nesterenkonia sp. F]|uniref:ABC transporter substrate-binding protein n=1 Tax=Nesterenkonia sp. F TaxID=795955 RepID=UPI000255D79B|nr:ABC transporter substrate-binding protein [Nesterenkonia sp. F]
MDHALRRPTRPRGRTASVSSLAAVALLGLAACSSSDPLAEDGGDGGGAGDGSAIVVGSQQYYSNTIIAELFAQKLEAEGHEVEREFEIGRREVYMPEVESGAIDLFPEYAGNLLQHLDAESEAATREEILAGLEEALPDGVEALSAAEATDQDSYVVTAEFAEEHDLSDVGDLAGIDGGVRIAANSEFATRPYGPEGLQEVYGVDAEVVPVEDSGGPLTVRALKDGDADVADIYSADPTIEENDLVVLEDPEELVPPQPVVPLASEAVGEQARAAVEEVTAELTSEELLALNGRSIDEQAAAEDIAGDWLAEKDLD